MSTNIDISRMEAEIDLSSTEDDDAGESDDAILHPLPGMEAWTPKGYWLGRKFFEFVVAEMLLRASHEEQSATEIDCRLQSVLRGPIDYAGEITTLQAQGIVITGNAPEQRSNDQYHAFMSLMGAIVRIGHTKTVRILRRRVRQITCSFAGSSAGTSARTNDRSFAGTSHVYTSPRIVNGAHELRRSFYEVPDDDLPRYTSKLKEYGDSIGPQPEYAYSTISIEPPCFKATVRFEGRQSDGTARTKRVAKHVAAKYMCERLGLRL